MSIRSLQIFAHATAAQLQWRAQKLAAITWCREISILKLELPWEIFSEMGLATLVARTTADMGSVMN